MYPVQYIAFAIFIFMVVFTVVNFRKSVLFWIPFHVLCNPMIALTFNPGIAVGIAVVSFQFVYYLLFVRASATSVTLNESDNWLNTDRHASYRCVFESSSSSEVISMEISPK